MSMVLSFLLARSVRNTVALLADYAVILWFFHDLETRSEGQRKWFAFVALLILAPLYFRNPQSLIAPAESWTETYQTSLLLSIGQQLLSAFQHWAGIGLFVWLWKEVTPRRAFYLSGLYNAAYLLLQNLRSALRFYGLAFGWSENALAAQAYVASLVLFGLAAIVLHFVDIRKIKTVSNSRITLVTVVCFLELYFRWSLTTMDSTSAGRPLDFILFAVCASAAVAAVLILFDANLQMQEKQNSLELEQMSLNYEMQNAKRALQTNTDIRRMYHDMKNHLLAIQSMAGDKQELQDYLTQLLPGFEDYENRVSTGNAAVDALLSEKMQRAALDGISFNICLNLRELNYISTVDLITIFGNALDNAIEAEQMLPADKERRIYLKSGSFANMTVLRISNPYTGTIHWEKGQLVTGKADVESHGIGLKSIRRVAQRYGGNVQTDTESEPGWFQLVIMLPQQN